jgi:hypothetical protein
VECVFGILPREAGGAQNPSTPAPEAPLKNSAPDDR